MWGHTYIETNDAIVLYVVSVPWSSRGGQGTGSRAPPLAGHCGKATMAQGGLHRGVAVCGSNPGPPVTQPSPGLVCAPLPQPTAPCVLHRYIVGWGYRPIRRPSGPGAQPLWPSARGLMSRGATGPALRCNAGQPLHQASQPRALLHPAGCLGRSWEVEE